MSISFKRNILWIYSHGLFVADSQRRRKWRGMTSFYLDLRESISFPNFELLAPRTIQEHTGPVLHLSLLSKITTTGHLYHCDNPWIVFVINIHHSNHLILTITMIFQPTLVRNVTTLGPTLSTSPTNSCISSSFKTSLKVKTKDVPFSSLLQTLDILPSVY